VVDYTLGQLGWLTVDTANSIWKRAESELTFSWGAVQCRASQNDSVPENALFCLGKPCLPFSQSGRDLANGRWFLAAERWTYNWQSTQDSYYNTRRAWVWDSISEPSETPRNRALECGLEQSKNQRPL
jgi:hypothetical protein